MLKTTDTEGEPRILGYAYIEQSPFIFVVLKHPEDVMQGWLGLRSNILWLFGVSTVLIMAVVLWSSTYLVNRVRDADSRRDKALHNIEYTNKMASIGRMAAGVAHEINNPLAIINENAGLLKDLISMSEEPPEKDRLLENRRHGAPVGGAVQHHHPSPARFRQADGAADRAHRPGLPSRRGVELPEARRRSTAAISINLACPRTCRPSRATAASCSRCS